MTWYTRNLTLTTGTGSISVGGIRDVANSGVAIGVIDINKTSGTGAITLAGIGASAGNSGTVDIGNTTTLDLNLAGTFFAGGTITSRQKMIIVALMRILILLQQY